MRVDKNKTYDIRRLKTELWWFIYHYGLSNTRKIFKEVVDEYFNERRLIEDAKENN